MTASTHNRKIKNLLKKGVLTGFEMAKIVISILWDSESKLQCIPHREVVKNFDPLLNVDEIDSFLDKNLAQDYDKHVEFDNWTMAFPIMVYVRDKEYKENPTKRSLKLSTSQFQQNQKGK